MHIIGFIIFGLVIGLLARAIYPGRQAMGWLSTAILGMIGSLVGGLIGHALFGSNTQADRSWGFTPGGGISSLIGAIIGLCAHMVLAGRPRTASGPTIRCPGTAP